MNIITKPRKTFSSLRGVLILAKRKEIKSRRKGTATAPKPKYSDKDSLYFVRKVPVCKNEKIERIHRTEKKINKID